MWEGVDAVHDPCVNQARAISLGGSHSAGIQLSMEPPFVTIRQLQVKISTMH